jgi:hypothetical protein
MGQQSCLGAAADSSLPRGSSFVDAGHAVLRAIMHTVTTVLELLLTVVTNAFTVQLLPIKVPAPLVKISTGAVLAGVFGAAISFDPHAFLLLFIPPLLFLDG